MEIRGSARRGPGAGERDRPLLERILSGSDGGPRTTSPTGGRRIRSGAALCRGVGGAGAGEEDVERRE